MRNLLYLFFFITLLSGCDKGIDDASKRNENWCWHVSKETGKGEWIELGGDNAFPDGWYTMFYSNGKIFEKGKTEEGTTIDTMSSFDIDGKISKYTYYFPDTTYEYYVNDGLFKAWDSKGNIIEEAIVKEHKIYDQKWYGAFAHFMEVMDVCLVSKRGFSAMTKKLKEIMSIAENTSATFISEENLRSLDSVYFDAVAANKKSLEGLNKLENFNEMPEFKQTATDLMSMHKQLLTEGVFKVIQILKTGYNDQNFEKMILILKKFESATIIEEKFSTIQTDFQEKFSFDYGQSEFMQAKYPEAIINQ